MRIAMRFLGMSLFGIGIATAGVIARPFMPAIIFVVIVGAFLYCLFEGEPR